MPHRRGLRWWTPLLLILSLCLITPLAAAPPARPAAPAPAGPTGLQAAFAAAAGEFGVPENVLLAVSYNETRWEQHNGAPSTWGGYGPMHLTQVDSAPLFDGKGDDIDRSSPLASSDPSQHTLDAAAGLLGLSPDVLKSDPVQNIRGGAALLAQYAIDTVGAKPASAADWYGAVAKYSGSQEEATAQDFADTVYATIQQGAARTTDDGQSVVLPAQSVAPNKHTADPLHLHHRSSSDGLECPPGLDCEFIPAAYQLNSASLSDYGNYDLANRPNDGLDIRYIVIHDTEDAYNTAVSIFQNSHAFVSSHYLIRSSDGHVAQLVENKNVAWHAGNWYVNGHAIGIEHEGVAIEGATWYTEQLYQASARLVRYLAQRYNIPLDRAHIVGHDNIPGITPPRQAGMHWDPGPFWDWAHYMDLLGAPIHPAANNDSRVVTIEPNFETNQPSMTYCYNNEVSDCRAVPSQSANFVYLYTAPSFDAPLITNPYIGSDPTRANNWANKAAVGQQFYLADSQGDWDAIYFSGQVAWFYNPHGHNTVRSNGIVITPKAGQASIPAYGRAYPEAAAYPAGITPQAIVPIYSIPAGQKYVAIGPFRADYYYAPTYTPTLVGSNHRVVIGQISYYQISFNHRFAYVMASDVDAVSER